MQAVVLAAGQGSRLREAAALKPLALVGGRPLLVHVLERLAAAGVAAAAVVTGHGGAAVRGALSGPLPLPVEWLDNPDWEAPNGVSALAARAVLAAPALLVMADHLVAPGLYAAVAGAPVGPALTLGVDRRLGHSWVDEDDVTRVATRAGRIAGIGKQLAVYDCYDTGVFRAGPGLVAALDRLARPSLSDGVRVLAARGEAAVVDVSAHDWIDIDDPRALALARRWVAENDKVDTKTRGAPRG